MTVSDNSRGLILAVASSLFIGASFIFKKKGLKRAAASGVRAGFGGHSYLLEPFWWMGMMSMLVGEASNLVAYVFAPAVLVTPLGALSIIISAVLAHFMLKEKLHKMGILGCIACIVGSLVIVIHAPQEQSPSSVEEIWALAKQPAFLIYTAAAIVIVLALVLFFEPQYGQKNIVVYLGICSLMGSLTVVSIKAVGIAIKLTFEGASQVAYPQTWLFFSCAIICTVTQLNYLNKVHQHPIRTLANTWTSDSFLPSGYFSNELYLSLSWRNIIRIAIDLLPPNPIYMALVRGLKALDTFNTAVVSPIYYVMFTTLTIVASAIMFKDWSDQNISSIASELCGFITILSGTILLHTTREQETENGIPAAGSISWYIWKDSTESLLMNVKDDYFVTLDCSAYRTDICSFVNAANV